MSFLEFWEKKPAAGINISTLRFAGAVEFGSRALGVHKPHSDYDFAILRSNFEIMFKDNIPKELPIKNYFKVVPPSGNNTLVSRLQTSDNKYLDILVLDKQEHLDMLKRAIQRMQVLPLPYTPFFDKQHRIRVFERELLKQGFRTRWVVVIANWLMKTF